MNEIGYTVFWYHELLNELIEVPVDRQTLILEKEMIIKELNNGKAVVIPSISSRVVLFESLEDALNFLETNEIPIEDSEDVLFHDRKLFMELENTKNIFFERLSNCVEFEVKPSLDSEYIDEISRTFKAKTKKVRKDEKLKLFASSVGIFAGESLKLYGKYEWRLERVIRINPYFVPDIFNIHNNAKSFLWNSVWRYVENKYSDMTWIAPPPKKEDTN